MRIMILHGAVDIDYEMNRWVSLNRKLFRTNFLFFSRYFTFMMAVEYQSDAVYPSIVKKGRGIG